MLNDRSTKPDTRERILQAAFTVLSRQGYENTSIKDIAEEAGVAQGLIHYHFKSKEQLVLSVLADVCRAMEYAPTKGLQGAPEAYAKFRAMLKDAKATHALYIQLIAVGLHDKEVGDGVFKFLSEDRAHIAEIARRVLAERGQAEEPAGAIASVVEAAVLGIIIQNLIDPAFDADEAVDALTAMSLSAVYPGAELRPQE